MDVRRENIAAAAGSIGGDASQVASAAAAGGAAPPGRPPASRRPIRRKGSKTHTYSIPIVFNALEHIADDLYHHLLHCSTCSMSTAEGLESMTDCELNELNTRELVMCSINLFEPFGQHIHTPRARALVLSWLTSLVLSQHPQAYSDIGSKLMPNLGDQLKSRGATHLVLDILHHVTPLVQSTKTLAQHRTALAGTGVEVADERMLMFGDEAAAPILLMDDGCFKPRPAKYGETRAPMAFFFRSLLPAQPAAKLALLPSRPRTASGGTFLDASITSSILRAWESSASNNFMAPMSYIYNSTNNQIPISKRKGPAVPARMMFSEWMAIGRRSQKYSPPPLFPEHVWSTICEQLVADKQSFRVEDMTVIDFVSEHLDSKKLVPDFEDFALCKVGDLANNYIFVVGDSPVYLAALQTLANLRCSDHFNAENLREAMIIIPGALHAARSAGKLVLRGIAPLLRLWRGERYTNPNAPGWNAYRSFGRMLNELHEMTAAFFLLAERRGWRADNLPPFEAQRRAFVVFTTLVPPVLLLIPVYKTGNIQLLQHIFQLFAAEFAVHTHVAAYQKVSMTFLTTLHQLEDQPQLWSALAAALPRCLDVAQETLVSVLSRLTPDVDVQNLDSQRIREVAFSFNVIYPEFFRLLRALNIEEEPRAFRANMSAETRLPRPLRQMLTMKFLDKLLANDAVSSPNLDPDKIMIGGDNSTACKTYVFPACRGMTEGPCGPLCADGKDFLWSNFSHNNHSCAHRTCLFHASALNLPDGKDMSVATVNDVAVNSKLKHIKLPSSSSRAPPRSSAAAAAARAAPQIGGHQLRHANKRVRVSYSDRADNITTKEQALEAVGSWKAFEVEQMQKTGVDMRHGSDFQRCNCRALAHEVRSLPAAERDLMRVVMCLSCGIMFLKAFQPPPPPLSNDLESAGTAPTAASSPTPSTIVYLCGRHGICSACALAISGSSSAGAALATGSDFASQELVLVAGWQCPVHARQLRKTLEKVAVKRAAAVNSTLGAHGDAAGDGHNKEDMEDSDGSESDVASIIDEDDSELEYDFNEHS